MHDISDCFSVTRPARIVRSGPGLYLARVGDTAWADPNQANDSKADCDLERTVKDGSIWACKLRGRLRTILEREGEAVYIGENVLLNRFEPQRSRVAGLDVDGTALIDSLRPRKTTLTRLAPPPWPGTTLLKQTLAVNVDMVVVVVAAVAPPLKIGTVDRHLILAAQAGIEGIVCVNKVDQVLDVADGERVAAVKKGLETRGVRVVLTSAATGQGIPELHSLLKGRTSVFAGPSGVGKTSILKNMCPALESKTLSISAVTKKGRHSTTYSSLIDIGDGYVADLPGLRAIGFWNLEDEVVKSEFGDIQEIALGCQFSDCTHRNEPGCAVRAALEEGELPAERFHAYMKVLRDAQKSRAGQERAGRPGVKGVPSRQEARRRSLAEAEADEVSAEEADEA